MLTYPHPVKIIKQSKISFGEWCFYRTCDTKSRDLYNRLEPECKIIKLLLYNNMTVYQLWILLNFQNYILYTFTIIDDRCRCRAESSSMLRS